MNLRPGRISFQDLGFRKDKDFLVEYADMHPCHCLSTLGVVTVEDQLVYYLYFLLSVSLYLTLDDLYCEKT